MGAKKEERKGMSRRTRKASWQLLVWVGKHAVPTGSNVTGIIGFSSSSPARIFVIAARALTTNYILIITIYPHLPRELLENMDVFSGISAVVTLLASVGTLTKRLHDAKSKYNDVGLYTATVTSQLSLIRAALDQIKEWRARVSSDSESSKQLDEDLDTSLKCCAILIAVITTKLGECDAEPGMKERINYIWHEDILKEYVSNLDGQIRALQLLLTIFQWLANNPNTRDLK